MQSVSSSIWTRVAVSISNGDNHYASSKQPTRPLEQNMTQGRFLSGV